MNIGSYNTLKIVKRVAFGLYLDGEEAGEILLPTRYVPADAQIGDYLDVFIYTDGDDRLIATTAKPLAVVGQIVPLTVKAVGSYGAFLEWGIMKDLFLPFSEQTADVNEGETVVVGLYLDAKTNRVVATMRWGRMLDKTVEPDFAEGDKVQVMIVGKTELGYKVLINEAFVGLIYKNEVFKPLHIGDTMPAYIHRMRADGKIDVRVNQSGYAAIEGEAARLMQLLQQAGGFLPTTDKSPAETIYEVCGMSKKTYKKAVGELYKKRLIVLKEQGIALI
ncbi:MAG: GntR family transcriptional regulator [Paludibacteraceae bacterium]|nr:GntR family transcriptional regulator [Paludibacteraceae bacterium]